MRSGIALRQALEDGGLVSFKYDVPGSRFFLPDGWRVRNKIVSRVCNLLAAAGLQEIGPPNLVSTATLATLDSIHPVSTKYAFGTAHSRLAASHEAVVFSFLRSHLRASDPHAATEIGWYFVAPAFRLPKTAESPFAFGERNTFIEAYFLSPEREKVSRTQSALHAAFSRLVLDELRLPALALRRPRFGNLPLYNEQQAFECVLDSGRTLACAMLYDQGDIFTRAFLGRGYHAWRSLHAGVTDNAIYAFLATHAVDGGFHFPSSFSPWQVWVSCERQSAEQLRPMLDQLTVMLAAAGIDATVRTRTQRSSGGAKRQAKSAGIPLFINADTAFAKDALVWVSSTHTDEPPELCPLTALPSEVLRRLAEHDDRIEPATQLRRVVALAETPAAVNELVAAGKVALMLGTAFDGSDAELSQQLVSGEILGETLCPGPMLEDSRPLGGALRCIGRRI